ncbi:Endothelin-converting enzyme 2 [Nowakowskiella sp. JEL0407]|nr:Endothelin-converting enzyme 2 [Nowakowskiella sp. JEL0407]
MLAAGSQAAAILHSSQNPAKLESDSLTKPHASNYLHSRSEENQLNIAPFFPHVVGPSRVLKWMNQKANPCNNFYEYSCGGFTKAYRNETLTDGDDILSIMGVSNKFLIEQLLNKDEKELAETPVEHKIIGKLRKYYKSCLNSYRIAERGFDPIIPLGNLVVSIASKPEIGLPKMLAQLNLNGIFPFIKTQYTKTFGKTYKETELQVYPAHGYKAKTRTISTVLKIFEDAGVVRFESPEKLHSIAAWVSDLEKTHVLFILRSNNYTSDDNLPKSVTMSEFNRNTGLDWNDYLDAMGLSGVKKVNPMGEPSELQEYLLLLKQVDKSKLKYYFLWRLAAAHFNKLGDPYYALWTKKIYGVAEASVYDVETKSYRTEHFQTDCVEEIGTHLKFLSGYLYTKYTFNDTQRAHAKELVTDLLSIAKVVINGLSWMDAPTKAEALKKADAMAQIVGYPDWAGDGSKILEYYESLDFEDTEYFENAVGAQAFNFIFPSIFELQNQQKIRSSAFDRDSFFYQIPWTLNAFHYSDYNLMQINPGILQRPLFSALNPKVMNYASLGMIIGHEITHAFDAKGRQFNSMGELKSWWSNSSDTNFMTGAQCFVDQYERIPIKLHSNRTVYVDGSQTLGENISDNGGLHLALEAWRKCVTREKGKQTYQTEWGSEAIPGFNGLTANQVFFVSFGQTWCGIQSDSTIEYLLKNDGHSMNTVRVQGVLQNSREFQEAFSCKVGDSYVATGGDQGRCVLY